MILLRPELFSFADPKSVCRLSCTGKTLHSDVRDAKPWGLLAQAQLPPPKPRDEADALARVRSHVRRRLLAKAEPSTRRVLEGVTLLEALSRPAPAPAVYTPNELSDFTFFLRLTKGERLIWEGDLGDLSCQSYEEGLVFHLPLRHANLKWPGRADDDGKVARARNVGGGFRQSAVDYLARGEVAPLKIALVAIRKEDQAMVSLGHFDHDGFVADVDDGEVYNFSRPSRRDLFQSARSYVELEVDLRVTQDGYVNRLEVGLLQTTSYASSEDLDFGTGSQRWNESQLRLMLSYLAGIHDPAARASALATIESWFVEAEQEEGWDVVELNHRIDELPSLHV